MRSNRVLLRLLVLAVAIWLALTGGALVPAAHAAGVWYVSNSGNDGNDCATTATPCASINAALNKPGFVAGDTVRVAVGTYTDSGPAVVFVDKNVSISGGWDAAFGAQSGMSTLDGQQGRQPLVQTSGTTASIEKFILRNGFPKEYGGGAGIITFGTLTINQSIVTENSGCYGGIYIAGDGILTLNNSTVSYNAYAQGYYFGGGIANHESATLILNNSSVNNNTGIGILNDGTGPLVLDHSRVNNNSVGGIYSSSNARLDDSVVDGNTTNNNGGGIHNNGILVLNRTTVSNNTGMPGGGIANGQGGTATLNNSTVSGNQSHGEGGGIHQYSGGTFFLNSSTVVNNHSDSYYSGAGGIQVDYGTFTLRNSIVASNSNITYPGNTPAPDCLGTLLSAGYNLIGNTQLCTITPSTGDLINVDPQIELLQDNGGATQTHALLQTSPAINTGNPNGCLGSTGLLTTDQRGLARVGRCDIGAFEVQAIRFATKSASKQVAQSGDTLTFTITLNNPGAIDLATVLVTDTLPVSLLYRGNSLTATSGNYAYNNGTITWNGSASAGGSVTINFGATVSQTLPSIITNNAFIRGGGELITRTASVDVNNRLCLSKNAANPVLAPGPSGSWDAATVYEPSVVKDGPTYKMWYAGNASNGNRGIGYATSPDGVTWTKYSGNPVLAASATWEGTRIGSPNVIKDGGTFKMWYIGRDAAGVNRIGYATSSDGISWTKYASNPVLDVGAAGSWESKYLSSPSVVKVGSVYHLWYGGYDGVTSRIGHATSPDGVTWTKDAENPVLNVGNPGDWDWVDAYAPNVVYANGNFILWYSGDALPPASQTGYAISTDGVHWTAKTNVIPEGTASTFDAKSADYSAVLANANGFDIWYSGLNDGSVYSIGYAGAQVCGSSSTPPSPQAYLPMIARTNGNIVLPVCPAYYTDNFSDSTSGWPIVDDANHTDAYVGGEYQMLVKAPLQGWLTTSGGTVTDFIASVTARNISANNGTYGLVFGINGDWSQQYAFYLMGNSYGIWKWTGAWTALKGWTSSTYVGTGASPNRLKVMRSGTNISVYANDHLLTTIVDSSFVGARRFGLAAFSPSNGTIDVRFDDFALYPVSCGTDAHAPTRGGFQPGKPDSKSMAGPPPPK